MRSSVATALRLLRQQSRRLPADLRADAEALSGAEDVLLTRMRMPLQHKLETMRIRRHGDYHLGQVLYTGRDFVIIDFEGEPARPLTERRLKRSALTDVAGMLRSLEYAAQAGLRALREQDLVTDAQAAELRPWADVWHSWCGAAFLRAYVEAIEPSLVPRSREALRVLLDAYLIDKAVYELAYELNNRPDWVDIPLRSILRLLNEEGPSTGA